MQDYTQAVHWYTKSAEQGVADAQFNLGNCYENGEGVKKSYAMAVHCYTKAAEQGNVWAKFSLQTMRNGRVLRPR